MSSKKKNLKGFPDEKTLKRIRDELSDPSFEGGNLELPKNASEVDRAKYELCQFIAKYKREHDLIQRDLAKQIGVDESRISDILRGKIGGFTIDRLLEYARKLSPKVRVQIVAA